ncbi:MAG: TIGR04283 family arsenosugar biosynthesis glycosyltransferase [Candidatus Binatia bacterium]
MRPKISIVIPVLNEEHTVSETLESLERLAPSEIIVVDGGSVDRTRELAEAKNVRLLTAGRGRARQMNEGARMAGGDVLLFLHADTRLPQSAFEDVGAALADVKCIGGRFDVELEGDHWMLHWIAAMISLRSRLSRVATGDQAIFVRRNVFEAIGGFPDIPIMEDIAFSRALKRKGRVASLRSRVVTSARRWEKEGVCRTILKMWILKLLYFAGVSPFRLKRFYADLR